MRRLLIVTGWFSDGIDAKHYRRAKRCIEPDWLQSTWKPYIERFVIPDYWYVFVSRCPVMPIIDFQEWSNLECGVGADDATKLDHRHDFHVTYLMGAQYARSYGMDFLYIEQDCLVYGLDKAIAWARDKDIVYGFGDYVSYQRNWAEQSLVWVSNGYIPEFLHRLHVTRFHEDKVGSPERKFHDLFWDDAAYWPFGYGRLLKLIDWTRDVFYAQQMTDIELDRFLNLP